MTTDGFGNELAAELPYARALAKAVDSSVDRLAALLRDRAALVTLLLGDGAPRSPRATPPTGL